VTSREIAFLMIGLGLGLMLAVAVVVELLISWYHNMFIISIRWLPFSIMLVLPFSLIVVGSVLSYRDRSRA